MHALGFAGEVVLHAEGAADMVAGFEVGVVGGHHFAYAQGAHYLAECHGRDVRLAFIHPAAHGRVQRQVQVAYLDLTLAGGIGGHRLEGEIVTAHGAGRAFGQQEAAVVLGHGGILVGRKQKGQFNVVMTAGLQNHW
ncbi:hypothetical protein D3C81_1200180 [compost metagenome]